MRYSTLAKKIERLSPKAPVEIIVLDWDEPVPDNIDRNRDVLFIRRDYGDD